MLHHFNNDGFTSHEGELHHNPLLYYLGIHHQTITDVLQCAQENVCAKEGLSMADSPANGMSASIEKRFSQLFTNRKVIPNTKGP